MSSFAGATDDPQGFGTHDAARTTTPPCTAQSSAVRSSHSGPLSSRDAADHVATRRRRSARTRVRQTRRRGRYRPPLRRALGRRPVLALRAAVVRDAADHIGPVVGERHGEDVASGVIANDEQRSARVEAEQHVLRGARAAAEPDAADALGGRREPADQNAVDQHFVRRTRDEFLRLDDEAAVGSIANLQPHCAACVVVDAGRRQGADVRLGARARRGRDRRQPQGSYRRDDDYS